MTNMGAGRDPAVVLLDLDGTLVDSAEGVLGSLRAAFAEVGVPEPEVAFGRELLGPPLYTTLPPLIGPAAAKAVVVAYRRIYAETGWMLSRPYPGVDAMLRTLAQSFAIAVATSKQEAAARMIVERQGWAALFATVCGDTPEAGRPTKATVISSALERLNGLPSIMVGDRSHDVAGAKAHGLACIGAGWGYAEPGELLAAGAVAVCSSPAEVVTQVRR